MGGVGTDGAKDCPVLIVVDHLDDLVRSRAPDGGIGGTVFAVHCLGLPVVVVVVQHQAEGFAAIATVGVGLFDGQLRAMKHAHAEYLLGTVFDGTEEADAYFGQILRLGQIASRARVDIGMGVVDVVRTREFRIGTEIRRLACVGRHIAIAGRSGRMRPTLTYVPRLALRHARALTLSPRSGRQCNDRGAEKHRRH